ncbi:glycosyltransferase [Flavobacterium sp.]|uniref:glycosyltransferase n=1 Tax=Flavobacterium sp. TaxID=239 RepID=UPI003528CFFF
MCQKSKILVIVTIFPSVTETFILNQITDLIDRGNDVTVFAYNKSNDSIIHQLFLDYNLEKRTITHFKNQKTKWLVCKEAFIFFRKYRKKIDFSKVFFLLNPFSIGINKKKIKVYYDLPVLLFKESFDVVHCHFGYNGKKIADAYQIGICKYPKAILSFHGSDLTPSKVELYKNLYKDVFKFFNAFTINSIYLQEVLLKINPQLKNYYLIPEGFKKQYLQPYLQVKKEESFFKIVYCGRLINWKGPDRALRFIKVMVDSGLMNLQLHIIGNGEMKQELLILASQLKIENYVVFHGAITQENVFKIMASSSVFLLPGIADKQTQRSEAQGLVLQEAQYFKLPVITSNVGGIKYGMIPNETGFLIESENEQEFVEKLIFLYKNPQLIEEMGKKGHEFVLTEFESKIIGDRLTNAYHDMIQ